MRVNPGRALVVAVLGGLAVGALFAFGASLILWGLDVLQHNR